VPGKNSEGIKSREGQHKTLPTKSHLSPALNLNHVFHGGLQTARPIESTLHP
jgi:hypothetical protein